MIVLLHDGYSKNSRCSMNWPLYSINMNACEFPWVVEKPYERISQTTAEKSIPTVALALASAKFLLRLRHVVTAHCAVTQRMLSLSALLLLNHVISVVVAIFKLSLFNFYAFFSNIFIQFFSFPLISATCLQNL